MASIKEGPGYIFIPKFFDQEELNILKSYTLEKLNDDQLALKCNDGHILIGVIIFLDQF